MSSPSCRLLAIAVLGLVPLGTSTAAQETATRPASGAAPAAATAPVRPVGRPAPAFEQNVGQFDPQIRFRARARGYGLALTDSGSILTLGSDGTVRVGMAFSAARPEGIRGEAERKGRVFHVLEPDKTVAGAPRFDRVRYLAAWPGTDVVFHGTDERQVRFDFELAPGADPGRIRLEFTGTDRIDIEDDGSLALAVAGERLRVRKPVVFQETAGARRPVEGRFVADGARAVRFALGGYDPGLPLVIDPTIEFASYLGTGADEEVLWAETKGGSVYVSGRTSAAVFFPRDPYVDPDDAYGPHCFISKFLPDGSDLAWSVVFDFNGALAKECGPFALGPGDTVHAALRLFLSGGEWGVSRFIEPDANGGILQGSNFAIPELQPNQPVRIQTDNAGNTYLAGSCNPGTYSDGDMYWFNGERTTAHLADCSSSSAFGNPGTLESILLKIAPDGVGRLYGTFVGGTPYGSGSYDRLPDTVRALVVDPVTEVAWVGGYARSADLPGTAGGLYPSCGTTESGTACMPNAFVARYATTASGTGSLTYATYYGIRFASDEVTPVAWDGQLTDWFSVEDLALEPGGGVSLFGNILRPGRDGRPYDLFVSRIEPGSGLGFQGVVIGNGVIDTAARIVRRPNGDLVLGGFTNSTDFPSVDPIHTPPPFVAVPFLSVLRPSSGFLFSTPLPGVVPAFPTGPGDPPREGIGIAVQGDDLVYAAWTTTTDGLGQTIFATGPFQNVRAGLQDAIVARFCFNAAGCPTSTSTPPTVTAPSPVVVTRWVSAGASAGLSATVEDPDGDPLTVTWDLPSGPQTGTAASGDSLYTSDFFPPGLTTVTVTVSDPSGATATATIDVEVVDNTPAGSGVRVFVGNDTNPYGGGAIEVRGDVTVAGNTSLAMRNDITPPPPADRQLGSPPYYYDVSTSAVFAGLPTVCLDIRDHGFADPSLAIHRYDGGVWAPLPSTVVEEAPGFTQLCAPVALGLSPVTLAILTPEVAATRIRSLAGTTPWDPVSELCTGPGPDANEGGPATNSRLYRPEGAVHDVSRNAIYFAETCGFRVRRLDLATGTMRTMTGTGFPSQVGLGGLPPGLVPGDADAVSTNPAVATLMRPNGVALDPAGNLYIADSWHCRIRKLYLDAAGEPTSIVTVAGTGTCGSTGDDGPALAARLGSTLHIRTDAGGVLYISDGDRVRRIVPGAPGDGSIDGNPDELITTYVGGGSVAPGSTPVPATSLDLGHALGLAPSPAGDLHVAYIGGILRVDAGGLASRVRNTAGSVSGPVGDSLARLASGELLWGASSCAGFPDWQCFGRVNRLTTGGDGLVDGSPDETASPVAGYHDWAGLPLTTPPAPPRNSDGDGHGLSARVQTPVSLVSLPGGSFVIVDIDNGLLRLVGPPDGGSTDNTPAGSGITVPLTTSAGAPTPVTVTFSLVTTAGHTVANPTAPPSLPAGFQIAGVTYDISTTAAFTPPVTVCIDGVFGATDALWHYAAGGSWELLPNQRQLPAGGPPYTRVCADTSSLSPFVVLRPVNRAPTVDPGPDQVVEATSAAGASVTVGATASDPDSDPLEYAWSGGCGSASGASATLACPFGTHTVTVSVNDGVNPPVSASLSVTVRDTTAPTIVVTSPQATTYALGQPVAAAYACSDTAAGVATCVGDVANGSPIPTSVPGTFAFTVTATDAAGNGAERTVTYTVSSGSFVFTGFFSPVDNLPAVNLVKGGRAVPVKFSLGGDFGLSIFDTGYPRAERVACDTGAPADVVEETLTAGSSGLQYDAATGLYTYVWKTTRAMGGACWRLAVRFTDGTTQHALFDVRR